MTPRNYRISVTDHFGHMVTLHFHTGIDAERFWQAVRVDSDATGGIFHQRRDALDNWRECGSFNKPAR